MSSSGPARAGTDNATATASAIAAANLLITDVCTSNSSVRRVSRSPTVAVRDLVPADLRLHARRHRAGDPWDHDETGTRELLGATKRVVSRDEPFHGVTNIFHFGKCAAPQFEPSCVRVIVDLGRWWDIHSFIPYVFCSWSRPCTYCAIDQGPHASAHKRAI